MIQTPHLTEDDESEEIEEAAPPATKYHVDTSWFAENGLSFEDIVRARMCDSCRAKIGDEVDERIPRFDKKSGRMQVEEQRTTFGTDPVRVIREHCRLSKTYITRDMPTLEAMFRVYLATSNEPMTIEEVRTHLLDWCPGGGCQWLLLPIETIERLIQYDTYYGLRPVTEASEE